MCPPWIKGAHAGAPLQKPAFLTSMSATWYQSLWVTTAHHVKRRAVPALLIYFSFFPAKIRYSTATATAAQMIQAGQALAKPTRIIASGNWGTDAR